VLTLYGRAAAAGAADGAGWLGADSRQALSTPAIAARIETRNRVRALTMAVLLRKRATGRGDRLGGEASCDR